MNSHGLRLFLSSAAAALAAFLIGREFQKAFPITSDARISRKVPGSAGSAPGAAAVKLPSPGGQIQRGWLQTAANDLVINEAWRAEALTQLEHLPDSALADLLHRIVRSRSATPSAAELKRLALLVLAERQPEAALTLIGKLDTGLEYPNKGMREEFYSLVFETMALKPGTLTEAKVNEWMAGKNPELCGALLPAWASLQAESAVALWRAGMKSERPAEYSKPTLISALARNLTERGHLDLALSLAEGEKPGRYRNVALGEACRAITREQLPAALEAVTARKDAEVPCRVLAGRFFEFDPEAAVQWVRDHSGSPAAPAFWQGLAATAAGKDPGKIKSWLAELPPGPARSAVLDGALDGLPTAEAKALLSAETELPGDIPNLRMVASDITRGDRPAGLAWAESLPDGPGKRQILERIRMDWRGDDPAGFLDQLGKEPDTEARQEEIRRTAQSWSGSDAPAWLEWSRRLAPEDRVALLKETWKRVIAEAPGPASQEALRLAAESPAFASELNAAVTGWTEQFADEAAAWVAALPPGPARGEALRSVVQSWQRTNRPAFERWLGTLSASDRGFLQNP
ncbi:MAG: hypothetical protein V4726_20400 [Verrucomicrobiota bacterium]